jgi:hypothetical protein
MNRGPLFRFLADDHRRLAQLLRRAEADAKNIDHGFYAEFRAGLLMHIAMEENILLPAARKLRGGKPSAIADKLRRDHGALAALLKPTLAPATLAKIRAILNNHNLIEEGPQGVYEVCEQLAVGEAESLVAEMRKMLDLKAAPHADGPQVKLDATGIEKKRPSLAKHSPTRKVPRNRRRPAMPKISP